MTDEKRLTFDGTIHAYLTRLAGEDIIKQDVSGWYYLQEDYDRVMPKIPYGINYIFISIFENKCRKRSPYNDRVPMPDWLILKLDTHKVNISPEVAKIRPTERRPYFREVGSILTKEQLKQLEDSIEFDFFTDYDGVQQRNKDCLINITYRCHDETGRIHGSSITQKYPTLAEYIADAISFDLHCDGLSMLIAYTDWNEIPDNLWEVDYDNRPDEDSWDFENNILVGTHIHDKCVEVLTADKTRSVYQEYLKNYPGLTSWHISSNLTRHSNK